MPPAARHAAAEGISLAEAALQLGVDVSTVRRWVQDGAPTVALGSVGRGHGTRVDVDALRRWRRMDGAMAAQQDAGVTLQALGALLLDFHRRDSSGRGMPAHRVLGIRDDEAALLYAGLFEYVHMRLFGTEPSELPAEVQALAEIAQGVRE